MSGNSGIAVQRTVGHAVSCCGIGLHSGEPVALTIRPAAVDTGIIFRRLDAGVEIRAIWSNTVDSALRSVLSNREGVNINTIEHLMAALAGSEVDNAVVELDGPEVPILDGSAAPFLAMIDRVGTRTQDAARRAIKVLKPVRVAADGASAALLPDHSLSMSFEIDFDTPLIRRQDMQVTLDAETFRTELSQARSFCLFDEVERMKAAGLARGGSLDNAVVIDGDRVMNAGGLRYADEPVRHKLLDAVGDLYLAGGPLIGQFHGHRSGHALTRRLLVELFSDPLAWCETTIAAAPEFAAPRWQNPLHFAAG
ncbi:MAG TPA: UDP-3-O-acyl-N-acetylglucosamine deacetylase [Stellaceae bacterium]|jgi:UDP-3-O-[3-hydroxymyristoyl] N-acetylglucosamine deacetylase|nr:UDP-3-O-acyl-N-acetylglucosamine deacetylase [Stellaceae bacterium]